VLAQMTPEVSFSRGDTSLFGEATRALIRDNLNNTRFEIIRISNLQVTAGQQTRRGTAWFRVFAKGSLHTSLATVNIGTADSIWSLGFQETRPGTWKVNRITPVRIPNGVLASGEPGSDRTGLGFNARTGLIRPTSRGAPGRRRAD
jgi:hypothetical protein